MLMTMLFFCKTPYQVLTAARIAYDAASDTSVDIVLFDTIAQVEQLTENIRHSRLFRGVYLYRCNDLYIRNRQGNRLSYFAPLPKFPTLKSYDKLFIANVYDWIENRIIRHLRRYNSALQLNMYEDGFSTYSAHAGDFFQLIRKSQKQRILYSEYMKIKEFHVFSPELMT